MIHEATFLSLQGPKVGNIFLSSFRHYLWLSPALFAIHAVEDAPHMAERMRSVQLFEPVSREQLIVALSLLLGLSCLCTYGAHAGARWSVYAFVWMQGLYSSMAFRHLIPSVWLLDYTPGLVTVSCCYQSRIMYIAGLATTAILGGRWLRFTDRRSSAV